MISWLCSPRVVCASAWARRRPSITGSEEDLGIDDVLGPRLPEVRHGEVVEVLLAKQDAHPLVVHGEERRQVGEHVCRTQFLDRGVRELEVVAGGDLELQLGLQSSLEVDMQLCLRHPLDEGAGRTMVGQLGAHEMLLGLDDPKLRRGAALRNRQAGWD
jgi:hypothetical protein